MLSVSTASAAMEGTLASCLSRQDDGPMNELCPAPSGRAGHTRRPAGGGSPAAWRSGQPCQEGGEAGQDRRLWSPTWLARLHCDEVPGELIHRDVPDQRGGLRLPFGICGREGRVLDGLSVGPERLPGPRWVAGLMPLQRAQERMGRVS